MSSRGRAAQLGSSSLRKSYACSSRALLLGAGWSIAEVKTRTGQDAPALALLDKRNSPSFHKVSKSELKGSPTPQDYLALGQRTLPLALSMKHASFRFALHRASPTGTSYWLIGVAA